MNKRQLDMTQGKPVALIWRFMLPLISAYLLQQVYVMVDAVIVGRGVGMTALAAIGATDMLRSVVLWGVNGIAEGFGIVAAILFGGRQKEKLNACIRASFLICIMLGIAVPALGLPIVRPLLTAINVPSDVFGEATAYLMIMYGGTYAFVLYGAGAAILRALGDSRTPFAGMLISSVMNILLDLAFVCVFSWGIAGAGIATIISQLFAGVYCLLRVRKMIDVSVWEFFDREVVEWIKPLLKKGIPMAFQNAFIAIGGVLLQTVINGFGVTYMAAYTAVMKIYLLLEGAALGLKGAVTTYVGQNYGSGNIDRIRRGMRAAMAISIFISTIIGFVLILVSRPLMGMFISESAAGKDEMVTVAVTFLFYMCIFIYLLYILDVFGGAVMGLGYTVISMLAGAGEMAARIIVAYGFVRYFGPGALYASEPSAWAMSAIVSVTSYVLIMRKKASL